MLTIPHWPVPNWHHHIQPGRERIKALLAVLGHPERRLPPVIHVAGTNGKGSTVAFLRGMLEAHGLRVHAYTSPHLRYFNERIVLTGRMVDDATLAAALEMCRLASERHGIAVTFFEGTTAAALALFAEHPADVVLLEVGMGGLWDATNVVEEPLATVITPIAHDHQEFLGDTLPLIASQKLGITRPYVPCITAPQVAEVEEAMEVHLQALPAPWIAAGYDWDAEPDGAGGMVFRWSGGEIAISAMGLRGDHQCINAGTAIATLLMGVPRWSWHQEAIIEGIAQAHWPARLQPIETVGAIPVPKGCELWLDGAHNPHGAKALSAWLIQHPRGGCRRYLIWGMTKKRPAEDFLRHLKGMVDAVIGVTIHSEPASYSGEQLAEVARSLGCQAETASSVHEAYQSLLRLPAETRWQAIIAGSLYLASDLWDAPVGSG